MELKDFTKRVLENGKISEPIFTNGKPLNGQHFADGLMINFKDGIITNYFSSNDPDAIHPAVEGPGYIEYRENGNLQSPNSTTPARSSEGFSIREFWENGEYIKDGK